MRLDPHHEMRVVLLNGAVLQFTVREMRQLIYGRHVLVLALGFLVAITASTPTLFPTLPEYRSRIFYWGLSTLLYLLLLPHWTVFASGVMQRLFRAPLPLVIATVPLVCGLTVLATQLPTLLGPLVPPRGHSITWVTFVKNCVLAQLIEMAALVWILPLQRMQAKDITPEDPPPAPMQPEESRFVVLSGRSFPIETIQIVRSAEHYLIVSSDQGKIECRARMKDFIEQVDEADGVQTHRSYWVSRSEARALDGAIVRTQSGQPIPVSRGRTPAVRAWFRQQGKPY